MKNQRYYITKQVTNELWYYITNPLLPFSVQDTGMINVDREEIRVDQFGAYVTRFLSEQE